MKTIIHTIVKVAKILLIIAIIAAVAYAGWNLVGKKNPVAEQVQASEYEKRVEQKMKDTSEDWKLKHKVWAEQEISREIIAEQEAKLEVLREKELSL